MTDTRSTQTPPQGLRLVRHNEDYDDRYDVVTPGPYGLRTLAEGLDLGDARLIAAAPDLLAALEAVMAAMDAVASRVGGDLTDREAAGLWNAARDAAAEALARAIGGKGVPR